MKIAQDNVLVIAAHPDDEVLGCGGAICNHLHEGDEVSILFMADGVSARDNDKQALQFRNKAAKKASAILGVGQPMMLSFPDNRLDSCDMLDLVQAIEKIIERLQPNLIYTHSYSDLNIDHRLTHQAVITACRPQPMCSVETIYSFEVLSATGWASPSMSSAFSPNVFIDITEVWPTKIKALKVYDEEMRQFPHARSYESIEALAKFRGATVGLQYAEAMKLERSIMRWPK